MEDRLLPLRNLRTDPEDDEWVSEYDNFVQLQRNDPNLKILCIGSEEFAGDHCCDFPHADDWGRLGQCIGSHEHLEGLYFGKMEGVSENQFDGFCIGLTRNRSIKRLEFFNPDLFGGREFEMLAPFFVLNTGIERLKVADDEFPCFNNDGLRMLLGALSRFSSLKELLLPFVDGDDNDTMAAPGKLLEALDGHSRLQVIDLTGNKIGAGGCQGLATMLQRPTSQIKSLKLRWASIDDTGALALADGLKGNATLKMLDLSDCEMCDVRFSSQGWRAIFDALQHPKCVLEELNVRHCVLDGDSATALASLLANNATIKLLGLSINCRISDGERGWEDLFACLNSRDHPNIVLERLDIVLANFGSDDVYDLADALSANNTLKELDLSRNSEVTSVGWQVIANALRSPESALEKLYLRGNYVDDGMASAFANSLATSTNLSTLVIDNEDGPWGPYGPGITDIGWGAFERALCDETNITSTFLSNHTLREVCFGGGTTNQMYRLLNMNRRGRQYRFQTGDRSSESRTRRFIRR